jgi:cell division protein FtsB
MPACLLQLQAQVEQQKATLQQADDKLTALEQEVRQRSDPNS